MRPLEDTSSGSRTRAPWWTWGCGDELSPGDLANQRRLMVLMVVWIATLVPTLMALKRWEESLGPAAYALALVPTLLFLTVVQAYVRFVREADELTRKIHLEGMAVGFGVGVVYLLGYPVFESLGAPDGDLSYALLPMVAGYVLGIHRAQRRYR